VESRSTPPAPRRTAAWPAEPCQAAPGSAGDRPPSPPGEPDRPRLRSRRAIRRSPNKIVTSGPGTGMMPA